MSNDANSYILQQFIEMVKIADLSQKKEIKLDIKNAKNLAFSLSEVLAKLYQDQNLVLEKLLENNNQTLEVRMDGGGFSKS
ncbi:MAG: hypothetical protein EBT86_10680 [Actinobacteria bacterium]|nr:hypothetical protein [Actinomycetota bacterium]